MEMSSKLVLELCRTGTGKATCERKETVLQSSEYRQTLITCDRPAGTRCDGPPSFLKILEHNLFWIFSRRLDSIYVIHSMICLSLADLLRLLIMEMMVL